MVFTAIPLSFMLMHLMLFIFYRRNNNNLYYALSMLFFAIMAYTQFGHTFSTTSGAFFWLVALEIFSAVFAIAFDYINHYRCDGLGATLAVLLAVCTSIAILFLMLVLFYIIPEFPTLYQTVEEIRATRSLPSPSIP